MPNVAGVQFPYTPQGQEAAQLYERSLSPSRGLGFRPIRMDEGGDAEAKAIAQGLYALMSDGTNEQVEAYVNKNRKDLEEIAKIDDRMFDMLRRVLYGDEAVGAGGSQQLEDSVSGLPGYDPETDSFSPAPGDMNMGPLVATGLGRQEALRAMGESNPIIAAADEQIAQNMNPLVATGLGRRAALAEEARNQAGTGLPPYLGTITPVPRNFEREPYEGPDSDLYPPKPPITPPMFPATGKNFHPSYTGPSRFGAGGYASRGTVAGELEPRGYLTARQAGETMRERAKGLRDRRNYGGGIGSLYNRYG